MPRSKSRSRSRSRSRKYRGGRGEGEVEENPNNGEQIPVGGNSSSNELLPAGDEKEGFSGFSLIGGRGRGGKRRGGRSSSKGGRSGSSRGGRSGSSSSSRGGRRGDKGGRSRSDGGAASKTRRRNAKGGFVGLVQDALVPLGLLWMQNRSKKNKGHKLIGGKHKSRKSRGGDDIA